MRLVGTRFVSALMLCLRVIPSRVNDWIDLPALERIQMGDGAFEFKDYYDASMLVLRSSSEEQR